MSSRSTNLEPKSQLTINLALRRKQKKKGKFPIKEGEKAKKQKKISDQTSKEKKCTERSLDQTISEQYRIFTKKTKKERKPRPKVVLSL